VRRADPIVRLWLLGLLLTSACGGLEGADGARATFRDSAGIRIAENPSPDDSADLVWWRVEGPLLDVGGEGVTEEYALFRMSNALRLGEDRFVVANGGATDLRYYDARGQHLATVGRQGEGPGEFRSLSALMRGPADTLIVYDNQARRFSVISPEPAFVRDFRFNDAGIVSLVIGRTSTGNFVTVPTSVRGSPDEFPSGLIRPEQVVTVHSADGTLLDTVGTFLGAERIVNIRQRNGEIVSIEISAPPFARTSTYVLSGDGLWVATQDGPEITRYRLDGTQELSIRTGRRPVAVTTEHIEALIEARLQDAPPATHAGIRSRYEEMPHPEFIPPYGLMLADATNRLWVADYGDPLAPPGRYTVYGGDGGVLARIVLPENFRPYEIGEDWILGRELDELDVEHLRLYRFIR
jgi:hypothetical protein